MKVNIWECQTCKDIILNIDRLKHCEKCNGVGTFKRIGRGDIAPIYEDETILQ